jgi:hypothetical protein
MACNFSTGRACAPLAFITAAALSPSDAQTQNKTG